MTILIQSTDNKFKERLIDFIDKEKVEDGSTVIMIQPTDGDWQQDAHDTTYFSFLLNWALSTHPDINNRDGDKRRFTKWMKRQNVWPYSQTTDSP